MEERIAEDISKIILKDIFQRMVIDMSEIISEDMSGRISKDMSERISEDMSEYQNILERISYFFFESICKIKNILPHLIRSD